MANRRMLSRTIGTSKKLFKVINAQNNNGIGEFAALLYTWAIPHTDDLGQYTADPFDWQKVVAPIINRPLQDFEEAICLLIKEHLLIPSTCGNVVLFDNNDKHQTLKCDRKIKDDYPEVKFFQWKPVESIGIPEVKKKLIKEEDKKREEEENPETPASFSSLQNKFLEIVSKYPKEFQLERQKDAKWLKDRVLNEPQFKSLDLGYEIDGWGTWLEQQHRKKEKHKPNQFPKADFKRSLTNRLNNALKYIGVNDGSGKPSSDDKPDKSYTPPEPIDQEAWEIWEKITARAELAVNDETMDQENFDTWFGDHLVGLRIYNNTLEVAAPDNIVHGQEWFNSNYGGLVKQVTDCKVKFVKNERTKDV